MNEDTIKLFEVLLVLHMENAITMHLRLPKKSEWYVRDWFIELLKPYNEKVWLFKYALDTEDLYRDFDEVKEKIHAQDTLFTDILIHGYVFVMIFFRVVWEEKWVAFLWTPEENRLIARIGNMIHHNPDYQDEITLHYNIEDYISKNYLEYPIIHSLKNNGFLEVKDIVFQNKELHFILHRFNNFPLRLWDDSIEKDASWFLFDGDTGKIMLNGEYLSQLKIGRNEYKFIQILYSSIWKSVSYADIKNHIKYGKISSTNEQYCQKIKGDLPDSIKEYVKATWEGYMLDK